MTQPSTQTQSSADPERRARVRRTFLFALVGTPWLLWFEPVRRVVSPEATALAVVAGVGLGAVVAIGTADFEGPAASDATQAVVVLGGIGVGTAVVWLVVPSRLLGTFVQFGLAFSWGVPVTQLLHGRYRATRRG